MVSKMGKVILGTGKRAERPYYLKSIRLGIRSMEELCYAIYHSAIELQEELFVPELYDYIGEELGLSERAEYMKGLLNEHAGAKDLMVAIFCSTDYYSESEIMRTLNEYDTYLRLKPVERKKQDADRLLAENRWQDAALVYQEILESEDALELSNVEYGKLLHNLAVVEARSGDLQKASAMWREAYERNHLEESLKQYLLSLKLLEREKLLDQELKFFMPRRELIEQMQKDLYLARENAERTAEYSSYERLRELHAQGRIMEYYQEADELLERLKKQCRESMQLIYAER